MAKRSNPYAKIQIYKAGLVASGFATIDRREWPDYERLGWKIAPTFRDDPTPRCAICGEIEGLVDVGRMEKLEGIVVADLLPSDHICGGCVNTLTMPQKSAVELEEDDWNS